VCAVTPSTSYVHMYRRCVLLLHASGAAPGKGNKQIVTHKTNAHKNPRHPPRHPHRDHGIQLIYRRTIFLGQVLGVGRPSGSTSNHFGRSFPSAYKYAPCVCHSCGRENSTTVKAQGGSTTGRACSNSFRRQPPTKPYLHRHHPTTYLKQCASNPESLKPHNRLTLYNPPPKNTTSTRDLPGP